MTPSRASVGSTHSMTACQSVNGGDLQVSGEYLCSNQIQMRDAYMLQVILFTPLHADCCSQLVISTER